MEQDLVKLKLAANKETGTELAKTIKKRKRSQQPYCQHNSLKKATKAVMQKKNSNIASNYRKSKTQKGKN